MAICEHTRVVRWTPRRVNAALRCPKPTGEIARFYRAQSGTSPGSTRQPPITAMIAAFSARHADILSVPSAAAFEDPWRTPGKPCGWLLVPATTWLIDALANLDAEHADLEPDSDAEPGEDEEDTVDDEHSDVRPTSMDRGGFPDSGPDLVITPEQRRRYRERRLHQPGPGNAPGAALGGASIAVGKLKS